MSGSLTAQLYPKLVEIPGGQFSMGGGYQYEVRDWRMHYIGQDTAFDQHNRDGVAIGEVPAPNNPERRVAMGAFFIARHEVSNRQYHEFLIDSLLKGEAQTQFRKIVEAPRKKRDDDLVAHKWRELYRRAAEQNILPDTNCWQTNFAVAYNEPLVKNYFQHPAFAEYPVVGVSWEQARAYCQWLTGVNNATRARKNLPPQPAYRLPTEAEWEYAARGGLSSQAEGRMIRHLYPWPGPDVRDEKGRFRANIKTDHGDYTGDGYTYACPVTSFAPNGFGLYNMAGNVSEWVEDVFRVVTSENPPGMAPIRPSTPDRAVKRVAKGGSWADYKYAARCGSRAGFDNGVGNARVGFRVARIKSEPRSDFGMAP